MDMLTGDNNRNGRRERNNRAERVIDTFRKYWYLIFITHKQQTCRLSN